MQKAARRDSAECRYLISGVACPSVLPTSFETFLRQRIACGAGTRGGNGGRYGNTVRFARESPEFDRSLSFFDAVYGFALTLLIANLDVPPPEDWGSVRTLMAHGVGTQLLGFIISFFVIVQFWRTNQDVIARLHGMDRAVVTWNVYRAGLVIFIPFTTQAMSDPDMVDLPLPTALYAVNISAAILIQMRMYAGAVRRGLVRVKVSDRLARAETVDALSKPAVFLASIPVAFAFGGIAGKMTWLLLLIVGPATGIIAGRIARQDGVDL